MHCSKTAAATNGESKMRVFYMPTIEGDKLVTQKWIVSDCGMFVRMVQGKNSTGWFSLAMFKVEFRDEAAQAKPE